MNASHANITTQSSGLMERTPARKDKSRRSQLPGSRRRKCTRAARNPGKAAVPQPFRAPAVPGSRSLGLSGAQQIRKDAERTRDTGGQLTEPGEGRENISAFTIACVERAAQQRLFAGIVSFKQ